MGASRRTARESGSGGPVRDNQRSRVYNWEYREIAPHDPSKITFEAAQGFVDAVWAESGLGFPPRVEKLPRQSRVLMADATRLRIRVPASLPAWCLLHEIAHAMTSTLDGASDGHGPLFVGVYVKLLTRYLRLAPADLAASLAREGIAIDHNARPVFLDKPPD